MQKLVKVLFDSGPLLFGLCFLAPLVAQSLAAAGMAAPLGLSPLAFGLLLGGVLGVIAQVRGRWL